MAHEFAELMNWHLGCHLSGKRHPCAIEVVAGEIPSGDPAEELGVWDFRKQPARLCGMTPVHQKLGMCTHGLAQVDGWLTQPASGCFVTAGSGHYCVLGVFDGEGGEEVGGPGTQGIGILPEAEQPEGC